MPCVPLGSRTRYTAPSPRDDPFLGICVGMQMLFDASDEDPHAQGLGVIPGTIRWLGTELPRPQMQWNQLTIEPQHAGDPMFDRARRRTLGVLRALVARRARRSRRCRRDVRVRRRGQRRIPPGNVFATQFHPEKSGEHGLALLGNFNRLARGVAA
jgi:glutamine amidotransferase